MAKNKNKIKTNKKNMKSHDNKQESKQPDIKEMLKQMNVPDDVIKKLEGIKKNLDTFKDKLIKKFDKYILGVALLPPKNKLEEEIKEEIKKEQKDNTVNKDNKEKTKAIKQNQEKIYTYVLVDDSDTKLMSKEDIKTKLTMIIKDIAKEVDNSIEVETQLLSELFDLCYEKDYEELSKFRLMQPIYDKGYLIAFKLAETHKQRVLKKFEKYILAYVVSGSLIRGEATPQSDVDVFIVVDDTDVKRMSRVELKEKLRAIILKMGAEVEAELNIKNKLNIQVYILTDYWESLKDANPIIFTLLRDGIPLYDAGVFMPWKYLLKSGKIKPSMEAIDMFMNTGEQIFQRVQFKLKEIASEDLYYAVLTPSQAALMLYGVAPPAPKETAKIMKEIFVDKEKMLEQDYVDILNRAIKIRKDIEHGNKKEIEGKEIDTLFKDAKKYLTRIKKLFKDIENIKERENFVLLYDSVIAITREALATENIVDLNDDEVIKKFEEVFVKKGKIPSRFLKTLKMIYDIHKSGDSPSIDKSLKIRQYASGYIRHISEFAQKNQINKYKKPQYNIITDDKVLDLFITTKGFVISDKESYILIDPEFKSEKKINEDEFEKILALQNKVVLPSELFGWLNNKYKKYVIIKAENNR